MKFRWKLLLLLTVTSILPIIGLRTFGIHNVRLMADGVIQKLDQSSVMTDSDEIRGLTANPSEMDRKTATHLKRLSNDMLSTLKQHVLKRLARVGHDPAIIYDASNDSFTDLKGWGTVLGILPDTAFIRQSISIHSGQVLCMFTDGIPETRNSQGNHFGRERLCQAIRCHAAETAKRMVSSVLEAVSEFRGDQKQEDDLTIMIVKILA